MPLILHWLSAGAVALVLSAAARALPPPLPMGSRWYLWLSNFAAILLANYDKIARQEKV
jgi:hypothetical protein